MIYSKFKKQFFKNNMLRKEISEYTMETKLLKPRIILLKLSFLKLLKTKKKITNNYSHVLNLKLKPNNIFCTLATRRNYTLKNKTSGSYNIRVTKKDLRYSNKKVVSNFLLDFRKNVNAKGYIVKINSPLGKMEKGVTRKIKYKLSKVFLKKWRHRRHTLIWKNRIIAWKNKFKNNNIKTFNIKPTLKLNVISKKNLNITNIKQKKQGKNIKKITPPKKRRRKLKKQQITKKIPQFLFLYEKTKVFNGCRAPKRTRKKKSRRKFLRRK